MTIETKDDKTMRSFSTGATRDTATGKLDLEGFTHPMVMKQFAKYMVMNQLQSDGQHRDSDNWQKGIPKHAYIKSAIRHLNDVWLEHRGFPTEAGVIAGLCGAMFNVMGYLHEHLKDNDWKLQDFDGDEPTPEMRERMAGINNETEFVTPSFCGNGQASSKCIDCTPECDNSVSTQPFQIDNTGHCMDVFDERCPIDCLDWQRCIRNIIKWNFERFLKLTEEHREELEDVPELPVCFGYCNPGDCDNCPDDAECDEIDCYDCDFTGECREDNSRRKGEKKPEAVVGILVYRHSGCNGCRSRMKLFSEYPCQVCARNHDASDSVHDFYSDGEALHTYPGPSGH
jgi:hypothetical protein